MNLWSSLCRERNDRYTVCMSKQKPIGIVVRRGALRRFDALARETTNLPVVVSWDRRTENRRESAASAEVERRAADRREKPPFTWEVADFVVVEPALEPAAVTTARDPGRRRKAERS